MSGDPSASADTQDVDACFSQDDEPVYFKSWMRPIEAYRSGMEQPKHVWQSKLQHGLLPRARMRSRGRVFGLSVSLFVCLFVHLSTTFWPIQASSRSHLAQ